MKIGVCYVRRSRWPKFEYVQQALGNLGHQTLHVETPVYLQAADAECDLMLFEPRWYRDEVALRSPFRSSTWVNWHFDLIYADRSKFFTEQKEIVKSLDYFQAMDVVFAKDSIEDLRELDVNAAYCDQGTTRDWPEVFRSDCPEFDVCIIGQSDKNYYRQRWDDVCTLLDAGFSVLWVGRGRKPRGCSEQPRCFPYEISHHLSRARIALHIDMRSDILGYHSDAFWMKLGAGACTLKRDETLQEGVASGSGGPWFTYYHSPGMVTAVRRLLKDPNLCIETGAGARQYAMMSHTYEHRLTEILNHVKNIEGSRATDRSAVPEMSR